MLEKIFCLMGASGAGKDTIAKEASRLLDIPIAIGYTTRPPREGERDGVEYYFIDKEDFSKRLFRGEFAEKYSRVGKELDKQGVISTNPLYFGFTKEELEKAPYVFAIITPEGLEQLKEIYGDKVVSIFISAQEDIRKQRVIARSHKDIADIELRFLIDKKDFANNTCDYIMYNNTTIEEAVKDLRHIILIETALKAY